jgi:hypothetical protein
MTLKTFPAAQARRAPPKAPRAPRGLSGEARSLWRRLQSEYGICDAGGLALLEAAVRAYARMDEARRQLDRDGCVVTDRWQEEKPCTPPLKLSVTRGRDAAILRLLEPRTRLLTPEHAAQLVTLPERRMRSLARGKPWPLRIGGSLRID